jgi:hypothetical protein
MRLLFCGIKVLDYGLLLEDICMIGGNRSIDRARPGNEGGRREGRDYDRQR